MKVLQRGGLNEAVLSLTSHGRDCRSLQIASDGDTPTSDPLLVLHSVGYTSSESHI